MCKRVKVSLITTEKKLNKLVSKPLYVRHKTVNESLYVVQRINDRILLNKPLYSGMTILEVSKRLMFDFHYHFTIKKILKRSLSCA